MQNKTSLKTEYSANQRNTCLETYFSPEEEEEQHLADRGNQEQSSAHWI